MFTLFYFVHQTTDLEDLERMKYVPNVDYVIMILLNRAVGSFYYAVHVCGLKLLATQ